MFAADSPYTFEMLSISHMIVLGFFLITVTCIIGFRQHLRDNALIQKQMKWILVGCLIFAEAGYQVWALATGVWNARGSLPLELCSFSTFLSIYVLLTYSKKAMQMLYFFGLLPGLVAMLTPDLLYGFPHIQFIRFFIQHFSIVWTIAFVMIIKDYRPDLASVFKAFLYLNLIALPIFLINLLLDSNYMFLMHAPVATGASYAWLGENPIYLMNLEFIVLTLFLLTYLPFAGIWDRWTGLLSRSREERQAKL